MSKALLRDNFDLILLITLKEGPKYGLEIITEVKERTDNLLDPKEGSLYPALHRLERTGCVVAKPAPSTIGGPQRLYYYITDVGVERLTEQYEVWNRFNDAVEALWRASQAQGRPIGE